MQRIPLTLLVLLLGACATPARVPQQASGGLANGHGEATHDDETRHARSPLPNPPPQAGEGANESLREFHVNEVALYALSLADTPYRYGGASAGSGFDCSGFVQHVYQNALGIKLPRTSAEMSSVGESLNAGQLRPGDLVFFDTSQRPYSHVGIYVGEQRFVHSPSSGKSVMVVSMRDNYWRSRYNGARRVTD